MLIAMNWRKPVKWGRVAALQLQAEVIVCVDSVEHLVMASDAGVSLGVEIPLLVELNIGMDRCGVPPGRPHWTWRVELLMQKEYAWLV